MRAQTFEKRLCVAVCRGGVGGLEISVRGPMNQSVSRG